MKIRWTLIACLALMTSCGKEIPSDIIQPEMMEKVLYDYHLSLSMAQNGKNSEKEAQKNYIFQKYNITEAEFDSSMVWYTRESQELMTIYENLNKRFKREYDHIERLLESREEANTRTFISGDTVDIWRKGNLHWFNRTPLNRKLAFEIKPDTTFHEKDAFLWNVNYHFFAEGQILMGMNVIYDNDSVIGMTKLINTSGPQSIYLHTDSTFKIRELNGFIYVPDDTIASDPKVLAHHITLTRYHRLPEDSLTLGNQADLSEKKVEEPAKISNRRVPRNLQMTDMEDKEEDESK